MKLLFIYFFIFIVFQSSAKTDNIQDFEIEGISIGDNLLDHTQKVGVSKEKILNQKMTFYPASKRFGLLAFNYDSETSNYYRLQVTVNPDNYKIYRLGGFVKISSQNDCLDKQKKITKDLESFLKNYERLEDIELTPHPADETGKSVANGIYLDLPSGDSVMVECYFWGEEFRTKNPGYDDNLRITLSSKELIDFINNEAY